MAISTQPDLYTLAAETGRAAGKIMYDQVFTSTPVYYKLKAKQRPFPANEFLTERVEIGTNSNVDFRDARASIPTVQDDIMRKILYGKVSLTGSVPYFDIDVMQNAGPEKMGDYVADLLNNATKTMSEALGKSLFAATQLDGKPASLLTIIDSTTAYGILLDKDDGVTSTSQIDPATYTWWAANESTTSEPISLNGGTDGGLSKMYRTCQQGIQQETPDLMICDGDMFDRIGSLIEGKYALRADEELLKAGFSNILYRGTPIVWDVNCPSGTVFFLNTNYLHLRPASFCSDSFKVTAPRVVDDTLATIQLLLWNGNLTCTSRRMQGKLTGKTTT